MMVRVNVRNFIMYAQHHLNLSDPKFHIYIMSNAQL